MKKIALLMMVKNEEKYAIRSMNSVASVIDTFVIYDTGSTDNTITEIKNWCKENKKVLHLKQGPFVNFCTSRNVLLRFANERATEPYFLLFDANDVLYGAQELEQVTLPVESRGALVRQVWETQNNKTSYWNVRFITNDDGWVYKGAVHEYLKYEKSVDSHIQRLVGNIYISQNRDDDGGKTAKRVTQDYDMLIAAVKENPDSARDTFYLARTCDTLGKRHEAIMYFERRLTQGDFIEEIFWSHMGIGNNQLLLGNKKVALDHYLRALEIRRRVEPLLSICSMFIEAKMFYSAYIHIKAACEMKFPIDDILFVNASDYDYKRWHFMGIVGYYCQEYKIGYDSCKRAYEYSRLDIDKNNLEFYLKHASSDPLS